MAVRTSPIGAPAALVSTMQTVVAGVAGRTLLVKQINLHNVTTTARVVELAWGDGGTGSGLVIETVDLPVSRGVHVAGFWVIRDGDVLEARTTTGGALTHVVTMMCFGASLAGDPT